jgi:quercetin dioxygenase-like cupin family protein
MTGPGGWFGNIFAWKPGMYTDLHRTVTVDFDVVLAGSVELLLEVGSATLGPGDCVLLPGTVHAWKAGPDGGLMAFTMVAGEATGGDVGRDRLPHSTITHGA